MDVVETKTCASALAGASDTQTLQVNHETLTKEWMLATPLGQVHGKHAFLS